MNTELIAESRSHADSLRVVMQDQAAETIESLCSALEALQAELDEWRFTNKIDELQRVNEGLQAEVARLEAGQRLSQASGNAWKAGWESTLARLEAVEAQNLMARQIILEHGSGTIAAAGASLVATPIVAWAKSTPRKLRITTMDMGREDGWRPLGYTAAGASPVEPSQAVELPERWVSESSRGHESQTYGLGYKSGWNDCLSQVAAINAKEPK